MKTAQALFLCLITCGSFQSLHSSPVDFRPHLQESQSDGIIYKEVHFFQGSREIVYRSPQGWTCTGNESGASLLAGTRSTARGEMRHRDGTPSPAFDEPGLNALRLRAQALAPALEDRKPVAELRNPVPFDGHDSIQYVYSGILFGLRFKSLVVLLPMKDEEFSFMFCAEEKEFDQASNLFIASLATWRWN